MNSRCRFRVFLQGVWLHAGDWRHADEEEAMGAREQLLLVVVVAFRAAFMVEEGGE